MSRSDASALDWRLKGAGEVGELVESGRVNPTVVNATDDETIPLCSTEGVGEHFVGDASQGGVKVLVAATSVGEFIKHRQGPASSEQAHDRLGVRPVVRHGLA
jgi:hypothetical protein